MNRFRIYFHINFLSPAQIFVKTEIGQRSRIYKMQDMYANSNEGMVSKLVVSLEQKVKKNP